jgi:hypothetical protein
LISLQSGEITYSANKSFLKQITQSAENYSSKTIFSLLVGGDKSGSSQASSKFECLFFILVKVKSKSVYFKLKIMGEHRAVLIEIQLLQ